MEALQQAEKLKEQLAKASDLSEAEELRQKLQKAERELQDLRAHAPVLNLSDLVRNSSLQVPSIGRRSQASYSASMASARSSCPPPITCKLRAQRQGQATRLEPGCQDPRPPPHCMQA